MVIQLTQAQYAEDATQVFTIWFSSVGSRSQAMGNTIVGIADDFSALFGNPAGLSQQKDLIFPLAFHGSDMARCNIFR